MPTEPLPASDVLDMLLGSFLKFQAVLKNQAL